MRTLCGPEDLERGRANSCLGVTYFEMSTGSTPKTPFETAGTVRAAANALRTGPHIDLIRHRKNESGEQHRANPAKLKKRAQIRQEER